MHVLSHLAHVLWGCSSKNYRVAREEVEGGWKVCSDLKSLREAGLKRNGEWSSRSLEAVLAGGWLFSFLLGCLRPLWAPLLHAQRALCSPGLVFSWSSACFCAARLTSSSLLHERWRWQSHIIRAGETHCGQWSREREKGRRQRPRTQQSLLRPMSRLHLPTSHYHSPTHPTPGLRLQQGWVQPSFFFSYFPLWLSVAHTWRIGYSSLQHISSHQR